MKDSKARADILRLRSEFKQAEITLVRVSDYLSELIGTLGYTVRWVPEIKGKAMIMTKEEAKACDNRTSPYAATQILV